LRARSHSAATKLRSTATNNHWPRFAVGCNMPPSNTPFREDAFLTTSADLAHVRDLAAPGQARATRWSRLSARQQMLLAAVLIVILCALVVPPFLFLLQASLTIAGPTQDTATFGLGNFDAVVSNRHFLTTSINSLAFAAASAM